MRTLLKHRVIPKMRQLVPAAVAPTAVLALLAPLWWVFAMPFALWAFTCLACGVLLGIRARQAIIALSGPALLLLHFGWSLGFWASLLKNGRVLLQR